MWPVLCFSYREAEEDGRRELEKLRHQLETEHNNYKTNAESQLGNKPVELFQSSRSKQIPVQTE